MSDVILEGLNVIQDAVEKMSPEEVHLRFKLSQCNKEIQQLKKQLEEKECNICGASDVDIIKYNEQLHQQLKEAIDVIGFYGNRFSWDFSRHSDHEYYAGAIKDDDSLLKYKEKNGDEFEDHCGGKRARQFLEKIKKEV